MVAELRWILLGLGALLLAGIWWWGARRSRQSPGNAELRETSLGGSAVAVHDTGSAYRSREPEVRDWGVPPFEPLNIRTADFDEVQLLDMPMTAIADPVEPADAAPARTEFLETGVAPLAAVAMSHGVRVPLPAEAVPLQVAPAQAAPASPVAALVMATPVPLVPTSPAAPAEAPGSSAAAAVDDHAQAARVKQTPHVNETQRIVTVRVSAADEVLWDGSAVLAALETHGLAYGRYKVFHRRHTDGRSLFCAASLVEPGTFDITAMPGTEFRGLTLFAVLPGPADPLQTFDALIATAVDLADTLGGTVQDSKGEPLTAQRAEALREDVLRFAALLTMT